MTPGRLPGALLAVVVGAGCVRALALGCSSFSAEDSGAITDGAIADGPAPGNDGKADDATTPPNCADVGFTAEPTVTTCPEVIASGQTTPLHLVVVGETIYWTNFGGSSDDGRVMSAAVDGGDAGPFAIPTLPIEKHPKFISAANGFIYWGTQVDIRSGADPELDMPGAVLERATGGSSIQTYECPAGCSYTPRGIAANATTLYWVTASGSIVSAPRAGGAGAVFRNQNGITGINDLDLDVDGLVFVARGNAIENPGVLAGLSFDASIAQIQPSIQSRNDFPWSVRITPKGVFWTERGSDDAGTGTLNRTSRLGSAVDKVLSNLKRPQFLAVDKDHVYVSAKGLGAADGEILRVKLDDGAATRLVSGLAMPHGIALDAMYVYWTTPGDGRVWRMRKP